MSAAVTGFARCHKAERYIKQLVCHWGHKMETSFDTGVGTFPFFETEHAEMKAVDGGIAITLTAGDAATNLHMRGVIERHLDRFAFREAPLSYDWSPQ